MIDWQIRLEEPDDTGPREVKFSCRVADSLRIRDLGLEQQQPELKRNKSKNEPMGLLREQPGKIENAIGQLGEEEGRGSRTPWVDFSGPVESGWNGIAIFDHPNNLDFPIAAGVREYGLMSMTRPYPTTPEHRGGAVTFYYRAYVHRGDAAEGQVHLAWEDYAYPCQVVLSPVRRLGD
jgi:hypothetical protein